MPYRICKIFDIESGHQLSKHPADCRFPHGHSRRVEVVLEAAQLDEHDMVCDFTALKRAAQAMVVKMDHAICLNTRDPMFATLRKAYGEHVIAFQDEDPTTEVVARTVFQHIRQNLAVISKEKSDFPLRADVRLVRVRVWETAHNWAEYEE